MCDLHQAENEGRHCKYIRAQAAVPRLLLTSESVTRLGPYARNASKATGSVQATSKYGRKERTKAARIILDVCQSLIIT